jgi:hypothetical protein
MRVEYADGSGQSVEGRSQDPRRDQRLRLSPLLAYWPTEFSRLRLQFNYDWADHLEGNDAYTPGWDWKSSSGRILPIPTEPLKHDV